MFSTEGSQGALWGGLGGWQPYRGCPLSPAGGGGRWRGLAAPGQGAEASFYSPPISWATPPMLVWEHVCHELQRATFPGYSQDATPLDPRGRQHLGPERVTDPRVLGSEWPGRRAGATESGPTPQTSLVPSAQGAPPEQGAELGPDVGHSCRSGEQTLQGRPQLGCWPLCELGDARTESTRVTAQLSPLPQDRDTGVLDRKLPP